MKNVHHETWKDFGNNLARYVASHKSELEKESYDIILSFSRGGTILSFAFACLLKDSDSNEYSKPHKASVRSIPGGIDVKIVDPCFVMDHPASQLEKEDIKNNLKSDLESFAERFNEGKPLKVLIMDDNLTGATRLKFLDRVLARIEIENPGLLRGHHMLAYVRHRKFRDNKIPTIISFPDETDYFVMPWHDAHPAKELKLKDTRPELEKLVFRIKLNCSFDTFKEEVKTKCGVDYEFRQCVIRNGASDFVIAGAAEEAPNFVDVSHFSNMFYPPKTCLVPNTNNNFCDKLSPDDKFHPLCHYIENYTIDVCNICGCLNCNKKLITHVLLAAANSSDISIKPIFRDQENLDLINAIDKWFNEWIGGAFWIS